MLQANLARVGMRQNAMAVRQNEDMRKISVRAAIALVPSAIAGIYGMNFDNMPELHWEYGYFAIVCGIVTACLVLHRLFRRIGWLWRAARRRSDCVKILTGMGAERRHGGVRRPPASTPQRPG